jgi:thiamine monophosphate synthase
VVGIGGINARNAASVIRAGADGVAVVSAVLAQDDVAAAARLIRKALSPVIIRQEADNPE